MSNIGLKVAAGEKKFTVENKPLQEILLHIKEVYQMQHSSSTYFFPLFRLNHFNIYLVDSVQNNIKKKLKEKEYAEKA